MIGYVTLGTNDFDKAVAYYDTLFGALGATRFWDSDRGVAWGLTQDKAALGVMKPYNGQAATVGNGSMVALVVDSRARVDAMHALALQLGGTDEGAAGPRGDGFYAGYFRDLDGNKLCFFHVG